MIPIMPLSVRDISPAVAAGNQQAAQSRAGFLQGLQALGQGFSDLGRGVGTYNVVRRIGNEEAAANASGLPLRLSDGLARGAEALGVNTGYLPLSVTDKMDYEQGHRMELQNDAQAHEMDKLGVENAAKAELEEQKMLNEQGINKLDLPMQNLYRSILGGDDITDSHKAMFADKLGYNKGLQEAMNGLEQFAQTDASGNLTESAKAAIATAASNLAAGLNAEAKRLTDAAGNAQTVEAKEYRTKAQALAAKAGSLLGQTQAALKSNAQNVGKDAMLVLAAVIENAFGTNKQAAAIETNKLIAQASRVYDPEKMKAYLERGNPLAASQARAYSQVNAPQVNIQQQIEQPTVGNTDFISLLKSRGINPTDEQIDTLIQWGYL